MANLTQAEKDKIELELLRNLENAVRIMFEFTDWDEGVDADAQVAHDRVALRLDQIDAVKNALL